MVPSVREAITAAATELCHRTDTDVRDLVRTAVSLRRTNIGHVEFLSKAFNQFQEEINLVKSQRERLDPSIATISDLAQLMDACAHFGVGDPHTISTVILPYIETFVDLVTEESSIRILHSLSRFPTSITPSSIPIVNLLVRKIGSTSSTSWEKHKLKLMFIWFSKCMHFPLSVDSEIRKFIIDKCLVHYLIARRGYLVPFPDDSRILWQLVSDAGLASNALFNEWIPNSPFHADVLIPERRVAVMVLSQFDALNPNQPVGTDALQCELIKQLGWEVFPIDRKQIRSEKFDTHFIESVSQMIGIS